MNRTNHRSGLVLVYVLMLMALSKSSMAQDGLYATLQTSMGDIRIQLHYDKAPRTVANFISLAEGTRAWLDAPTGQAITNPLYDGVIFHRVITNFMIQSGSPTGTGSGGPGFAFSDEFHTNLTHSTSGVVSMANSGPNSNGSQFFITVAPTPWLDNVHSVFGIVVQGYNVAKAISEVPVVSEKPITPVVINHVAIERIGAAAQAFNPASVSPDLPIVLSTNTTIGYINSRPAVSWNWRSNSVFSMFFCTNIQSPTNWTQALSGTSSGVYIDGLMTSTRSAFFRTVEVQYFE